MDVAAGRERAKHLKVARQEDASGRTATAAAPDQGDLPLRQIKEIGLLAQARARSLEALGGTGLRDALIQAPPQLGLPDGVVGEVLAGPIRVLPLRPGADHLRSLQCVAVKEIGEVPDAAEPARPPGRVGVLSRSAQVPRPSR